MHRTLYQERTGKTLPAKIVVRHTCDDRRCINQDHLVEGSHAENTQDMVERGRLRFQFGERHSHAELTNAQVEEVIASTGTQTEIAEQFGIHQSTVSRLKNGKRRKDITCKKSKDGTAGRSRRGSTA